MGTNLVSMEANDDQCFVKLYDHQISPGETPGKEWWRDSWPHHAETSTDVWWPYFLVLAIQSPSIPGADKRRHQATDPINLTTGRQRPSTIHTQSIIFHRALSYIPQLHAGVPVPNIGHLENLSMNHFSSVQITLSNKVSGKVNQYSHADILASLLARKRTWT